MNTASFPRCVPSGLLRLPRLVAGSLGLAVALTAAAAPFSPLGPITKFRGQLAGVSAVSPVDAWAVGSTNANTALILHWNGTGWTRVPGLGSANVLLNGVNALSASDAWAVGESGSRNPRTLVLHWNGTAWAQVPSPNPGIGHSVLFGVNALSPSDAWAVGSYDTGRGTQISSKNLVLHWNGSNWTKVASPSPGPIPTGDFLGGVSALSPSNAWAVGQSITRTGNSRTVVLHWNSTRWIQS